MSADNQINREISNNIRALLDEQGRTQKWLAFQMLYTQEGISARMNCKRNWTIRDLYAAAYALDTQPQELMPELVLFGEDDDEDEDDEDDEP